ncbi:hypothetical protein DMH03_31540 [Amycolatopsis sp. WAC 01376]|uniref:hypothetical protein n=1 Tax=Amycolatopsis sp. WAC 01376 TaxID=2203195 RepID=UPI000F787B35|nr:hypothetical protein [Amycolatopsis sp. WAC 01376]RSM56055.1 hypothetical protein DMH03_31540 [Amycolatopsis sp. WAC 01376]
MTAWWGLTGLLGLLGAYGLVRIRHRAGAQAEAPAADVFARYPAAQGPAVPNADTAHTPLMIPAVTPEMIRGPRRWRASRPSGVRARESQQGLAGTQAVAEPLTDAGTVPAQASPPEPETQPVAAVPEPRPSEEGTITGELTPDRPAPEDASEEPKAAEPEETTNRFRPRRVLDTVIRKAKEAKKILRRN